MTDEEAKAELDRLWAELREPKRTFAPLPSAVEVSREMYRWLAMHADTDGYHAMIELRPTADGMIQRIFGIPFRATDNAEPLRIIE